MKWVEWPSPLPAPRCPSSLLGQASLRSYGTQSMGSWPPAGPVSTCDWRPMAAGVAEPIGMLQPDLSGLTTPRAERAPEDWEGC